MKYPFCGALILLGGCASQTPLRVGVKSPRAAAPTSMPKAAPRPKVAASKPPVASALEVRDVEFSPDLKWLAVGTRRNGGDLDGTVTVRDCANSRVVKSWKLDGGAKSLAFSPDGTVLAGIGTYGKLSVWDWKHAKSLHREVLNLNDGSGEQTAMAFSPDGHFLATGINGVHLLDTKLWKNRKSLSFGAVSGADVENLGFSSDSRILAVSLSDSSHSYVLVNLKTGRNRYSSTSYAMTPLVFSPDGTLIAGRDNRNAAVWKTRTWKIKQNLKSDQFYAQAFSPDARLVAGLVDYPLGRVEIWSVSTGKRVRAFKQTARRLAWLNARTLLLGDENGARRLRLK